MRSLSGPLLARALPEEQAWRIVFVECAAALRAAQVLLALAAVPLLAIAFGFADPASRRASTTAWYSKHRVQQKPWHTPISVWAWYTWARSGRGRAASDIVSLFLFFLGGWRAAWRGAVFLEIDQSAMGAGPEAPGRTGL